MTYANRAEPSGGTDDATGAAADAFDLLGDETRLGILLALWEAYDPSAGTRPVSFSELRERVGSRDSGGFNYHLKKLEGPFVRKTEEGYVLQPVGLKLVQTVIAGVGGEPALPATRIEVDCYMCGTETSVLYRDGWLYHVCPDCETGLGIVDGYPEGVLFAEPFPAAALAGRTAEEVFAAGVYGLLSSMETKMAGLCPRCSGAIDAAVTVCGDHHHDPGEPCDACGTVSEARVAWVCSVCKYSGGSSLSGAVLGHPAVVSFYHDRGVEVGYPMNDFERAREVLGLLRSHEQVVVSTDPVRIRVTVRLDGDELSLTLDDALDVVELEGPGP